MVYQCAYENGSELIAFQKLASLHDVVVKADRIPSALGVDGL